MNNTKAKSAEMGLQSALLYMYAAYTEDEGLTSEQAKEKIKKQAFKALNKIDINVEGVSTASNNGYIVKDLKKNIEVLKNYNNVQINYVAKAIEYNLSKLVGDSK